MKCFVISLKTASKRQSHINQAFSAQGIPFEFFDAITPDINDAEASRLKLVIKNTSLSQAEVSCLLSHVAILQKIVDESIPYGAIFEDDIHLGKGADRFLCDDNWIPPTMGLIKLEKFNNIARGQFGSSIKLDSKTELFRLKGRHLGAAGYIVSHEMARQLLNELSQYDSLGAIDKIIFEEFIIDNKIDVFQLQPAICAQDSIFNVKNTTLHSGLNADRIVPKKQKISLLKRFKREFDRAVSRRIDFDNYNI
ncbi:glycosyltransferase family 25 protein [uncultured Shewanella sp.]|uniref:glycosyltransferase family 25 protein n=1 Tax=uncultured Shewanella sp. TaxID=173975 RepID=UPI002605C822|nr:glycosyltransferase family 25 protein [uncultured Shewanella sp.]